MREARVRGSFSSRSIASLRLYNCIIVMKENWNFQCVISINCPLRVGLVPSETLTYVAHNSTLVFIFAFHAILYLSRYFISVHWVRSYCYERNSNALSINCPLWVLVPSEILTYEYSMLRTRVHSYLLCFSRYFISMLSIPLLRHKFSNAGRRSNRLTRAWKIRNGLLQKSSISIVCTVI